MSSSDSDADRLDDEEDRDELRRRYYGLMQELRVVLPGVQVLVAFLLTAPFNDRFSELDDAGRTLWGTALVTGLGSVIAFATPTALHRFGPRTARAERLEAGITSSRIGLGLLGISLLTSLTVVARFIFGTPATVVTVALVGTTMVGCWFVYPLVARARSDRS